MATTREGRQDERERASRLRAVFEDAPMGFGVVDRAGRLLETNATFRALLERDEASLRGLTFLDVTHPADTTPSRAHFEDLRAHRIQGYTYEKRYLRPDGTSFDARTTVRRISEGDDDAAFAVAVIEDVTDRRRAEREIAALHAELRAREERYRTLVTNIPGAIYRREIAAPQPLRFVSEAILDIAGVPATELLERGASFLDLVHPDDRHLVTELADRDLGIGESYVVEYRVRTPAGEVRWVHDRGRAIAGRAGGEAELFDGILSDVTQRRVAEEQLREHELREHARAQEREHVSAIEGLTRASMAVTSTLGLVEMLETIVATARQVVGATDGAVALLPGDGHEELVCGAGPHEDGTGDGVVPTEGSVLHHRVFAAQEVVHLAGDELRPGELRPVRGGRLVLPRELIVAPLVARDGTTIGVLSLRDGASVPFSSRAVALASQLAQTAAVAVEKSRLAELAAVREAVRFRDELMAGMSHDMQTPLSAIVGAARVLEDDPGAPRSERAQLYEVLARQSVRLQTLVQQFLDHARLEVDRPLVVRLRTVDLASSLSYARRLFLHQREVRLDVPDDLPPVVADADRLQQVLSNLLANAIAFSDDPVDVVVSADDREVHVDVVDRGIGMDAEDLAGLFGRFHRGANAEGTHGTGLGLYVSRAVADAMHGRLTAESAPGEGSRFRLTLPRATG